MAKRRRVVPARTHVYQSTGKPGFSRRQPPRPARRRGIPTAWRVAGGAIAIAVLLGGAYALGAFGGPGASTAPTVRPSVSVGPPAATPLANPPSAPAGDGTRATIETELGTIVMELFTESSPVAAENFMNLAEAGFYDGVVFHRTIQEFMIQGGDPDGTGSGGPGYTIPDDPVVGNYSRGQVAMARPAGQGGAFIPDSQGSQFFILVADRPELASGGYSIFGQVVQGMDVVDQIVRGQTTGPPSDSAIDPVVMTRVTIQRPGARS